MPTPRRTLTLVLLSVAAGSLLFATGAAVIDGPADTFADDRLAVQPADGPNGNYAYLNDDDEIVVDVSASNPNLPADFEGLNADTLASADGVFEITYTADEYAHVWIEHDGGDAVTFTADGESIENETNNVTLGPNQTVAVGLVVDARGEVAGTQLGPDEFSINGTLAEPGDMTTTGWSTQGTRNGGPTVTTASPSADRREFVASDVDRGETIRFRADGMSIDSESVTLHGLDLEGVRNDRVELNAEGSPGPFANESTLAASTAPRSMAYLALEYDFAPDAVDAMTLRFSADPDHFDATDADPEDVTLYRQTDAGEWEEKSVEIVDEDTVRLSELPEDRVHFRATTEEFSTFAVAERVPRIGATGATLDETAVEPGGEAVVRATVENTGGADGEQTVALTADGEAVAAEPVALDPGEETALSLRTAFESPGEYELAVDGVPAGTLTVGDPAAGTEAESNAGAPDSAAESNAEASDSTGASSAGGPGPIEEPSGIDAVAITGLLALAVLAVAGVALVRRMPQ
ncbi:CARDB domain-containing protein [Halorubrum sp. DTA46]|uniref:CARDB domain-containing protein n=1 Tax=Halorubrum sp. DTA46 TaxID=3402162 RepID=UPI003AB064F3